MFINTWIRLCFIPLILRINYANFRSWKHQSILDSLFWFLNFDKYFLFNDLGNTQLAMKRNQFISLNSPPSWIYFFTVTINCYTGVDPDSSTLFIILGFVYISLSSCFVLSWCFSLTSPNILLSILLLKTRNSFPLAAVRVQVSDSYITTGWTIVLWILIYVFLAMWSLEVQSSTWFLLGSYCIFQVVSVSSLTVAPRYLNTLTCSKL